MAHELAHMNWVASLIRFTCISDGRWAYWRLLLPLAENLSAAGCGYRVRAKCTAAGCSYRSQGQGLVGTLPFLNYIKPVINTVIASSGLDR